MTSAGLRIGQQAEEWHVDHLLLEEWQLIREDMLVEELVEKYPKAIGLLMRRGIGCLQCGEPLWGTLEQAARAEGIEDIDALVREINSELGDAVS